MAEGLDVVKICLQSDVDWISRILFERVDAGLPLFHRVPVTESHVTLSGFVSQKVQHFRGAVTGLQQQCFLAVT